MESLKHKLGKRIKMLRKLKGLTQEQLGEKAGLSYKFVGEIERGTVNPSLDSLSGIAKALDVSLSGLLPTEGDIFSTLSPKDLQLVKKALGILNKTFSSI